MASAPDNLRIVGQRDLGKREKSRAGCLVLHLAVGVQVMDTCFVKTYPLDSALYCG